MNPENKRKEPNTNSLIFHSYEVSERGNSPETESQSFIGCQKLMPPIPWPSSFTAKPQPCTESWSPTSSEPPPETVVVPEEKSSQFSRIVTAPVQSGQSRIHSTTPKILFLALLTLSPACHYYFLPPLPTKTLNPFLPFIRDRWSPLTLGEKRRNHPGKRQVF